MPHPELLAPAADLRVARVESAPFAENSYVVFTTGTPACLVVDPGFDPDAIVDFLRGHGLEPAAILLTHGHSDHIAGTAALRRHWPAAPILIGRGDAPKLTDPAANLSAAFGFAVTSPPADRLLDDGERLDLAGLAIDVFEIPGHSSGHVVFVLPGRVPCVVLAGDVLFRGSVGRTDFPDGDFSALASGIRRRLYTLPDDTLVLPGHGPPTTIGHEKRHNPFVPATGGPPAD
ncbi:MAG: MBL fold metallo-hydrolase [Planctomycetia bacterium]|nr:MBL fold metallo-hydrolase [Planctomycetia bacterium]